jgi:hypothetical protein
MSFQPVNLVLWSASPLTEQPRNLPRWWAYLTTDDDIAEVSASGYFNIAPYALLQNVVFNIGDKIYCVCTDGNVNLTFTNVYPPNNTTTA